MAYYIDTSAAMKLVLEESESSKLRPWVRSHASELVSSDLLRTELFRGARRIRADAMPRVRGVLDSITLFPLPTSTFERAAELEPDVLRTLDALHLAAALELGDDLDGIVTYDERLAQAAARHGVTVLSPGAPA